MKNKINIERMIELENMLDDDNIIDSLTNKEIYYINKAKKMPYENMLEDLIYYQKNCLLIDKLVFISNLKKKYSALTNEVEERILEVQRIYKYYDSKLNKELKEQKRMIKRMNNIKNN